LLINVDTESEFVFPKSVVFTSVLTMKLFCNGQVVETLHGYQSEPDLKKVFGQYVSPESDKAIASLLLDIHKLSGELSTTGYTENLYHFSL